jgi:proline iminopeptidase
MGRSPRMVAEFSGLLSDARLVDQPRAGHFPWLDNADQFVAAILTFLAEALAPLRLPQP